MTFVVVPAFLAAALLGAPAQAEQLRYQVQFLEWTLPPQPETPRGDTESSTPPAIPLDRVEDESWVRIPADAKVIGSFTLTAEMNQAVTAESQIGRRSLQLTACGSEAQEGKLLVEMQMESTVQLRIGPSKSRIRTCLELRPGETFELPGGSEHVLNGNEKEKGIARGYRIKVIRKVSGRSAAPTTERSPISERRMTPCAD